MAFVLAMGFAALCFGALSAVCGLCVGIETQKRRSRTPEAAGEAVVVVKRQPDDLDRLGVKRLG